MSLHNLKGSEDLWLSCLVFLDRHWHLPCQEGGRWHRQAWLLLCFL